MDLYEIDPTIILILSLNISSFKELGAKSEWEPAGNNSPSTQVPGVVYLCLQDPWMFVCCCLFSHMGSLNIYQLFPYAIVTKFEHYDSNVTV